MISLRKQNFFIGSVVVLLFAALCWFSFDFMRSVQRSLWDNSVKNIMESTARGASVLQRGYVKDIEMLRMLANELEQEPSTNVERIRRKLKTFLSNTGSLSALIFEDGTGYVDSGLAVTLSPEELATVRELHDDSGLLFPYRNRGNGRRTFTIYAAVAFPNGPKAYLFKGYSVETLYSDYALSFYNNTGFSYVVAPNGDIAMRSVHPASNKTFANLFDIIGENGNNFNIVESFRKSLKSGKTGMAVFNDKDGENVFCYVPMPRMGGWYVVSIVPNEEIMREAYSITRKTLFICFLVFAGFLVAFLIYLRLNRSYEKEIRALAYRDRLTGVRNLTKFRIDGNALLEDAETPRYAVLSLDILNFKIFNDVMGHEEGDALLKAFAGMLKSETSHPALIARVVADTFLVLFPYEERDELPVYCEALLQAINAFVLSRGRNYRIELRCGICCVEDSDAAPDINTLLDRANIALKAIKTKGAPLWNFYDHTMRDRLLREKELEMRMEKALVQGEFLVYVQPKYWVQSRELAGGEVLVRWKSADQGFLSPGEFIPLFEKNRFIVKLDQFMFSSVCVLLRRWLDAGVRPCPLSVNISRVQFYTPDFVETYSGWRGELNMATVAEGVETQEQVAFLETTGCDIIQGYVFARPMPVAEFAELLGPSEETR